MERHSGCPRQYNHHRSLPGGLSRRRTALTAAFDVQAEALGQATLPLRRRAAQALLVQDLEEVLQLCQQLLQR